MLQGGFAARVVVVGGGASGTFAAIAAKRCEPSVDVVLLEGGSSGLRKVLASGGGRCNVMHSDELSIDELVANYPRGSVELKGPFAKRFGPRDTRDFFEAMGVELKTENDGRVFPTTDNSRTIADALQRAAFEAGVVTRYKERVADVLPGFRVVTSRGEWGADAVVLATGSAPAGYHLAAKLGHDVAKPYPSLFSFRLEDGSPLASLAGVSLDDATLALDGTKHEQGGPLLVTHRGVSGPCALKLSAFAARHLADVHYKGTLVLNALPGETDVRDQLSRYRKESASQLVGGGSKGRRPFAHRLPRRLWANFIDWVGLDPTVRWADLSNRDLDSVAEACTRLPLPFKGKDANKEEFVTAGGVLLKQIDTRTMQSKLHPGLHFVGELLDVDAVTGGFNFQHCWTSGHLAGNSAAAIAARATESRRPEQTLPGSLAASDAASLADTPAGPSSGSHSSRTKR